MDLNLNLWKLRILFIFNIVNFLHKLLDFLVEFIIYLIKLIDSHLVFMNYRMINTSDFSLMMLSGFMSFFTFFIQNLLFLYNSCFFWMKFHFNLLC